MPLHVGAVSGGAASGIAGLHDPRYEVLNPIWSRESDGGQSRSLSLVNGGDSESSEAGDDEDQEEHHHKSCCWRHAHHLLQTHFWSAMVMIVIGSNTLMMAIQCNYPHWPHWWWIEDTFLVFFLLEITLRLYVHGFEFFTEPDEMMWNIFDFTVVASGVLDVILESQLKGKKGGQVMVIMRIVRIVRVLRSCRLLKHFRQLYLLVLGFMHSLQAVFWIGVLFFLVVLIAGIVTTCIVGHNSESWADGSDGSQDDADTIQDHFGTLPKSMVTMFQLVTLDNWGDVNCLVAKRMPVMTVFFIIYILATAFAMIALLTGVITEHVTDVSREAQSMQAEEKFAQYVSNLEWVFRKGEALDGKEGIMFEHLCILLKDPKVAEKMDLDTGSEVAISDLQDIFQAMDTGGDGRVSWNEFRQGLKELRGEATAKEVALLRADLVGLRQLVAGLVGGQGSDVGVSITGLERQVGRIEGTVCSFVNAVGGNPRLS